MPYSVLLGAAWAVLTTEATRLACRGCIYAAAVIGSSSSTPQPSQSEVAVRGLLAGRALRERGRSQSSRLATDGDAVRPHGRASRTARPGAPGLKGRP